MNGIKNPLESNLMKSKLVLKDLDGFTISERDLTLAEQDLIREVLQQKNT